MSDKHDFEEMLEPAQAAAQLKISVATLRKYSLIVEDVTGNGEYFVRTKQKTRLYSAQNVADLHDFKQLSKDASLTLKEAARQIYAVEDAQQSAPEVVVDPDNLNQGQVVELLQLLQSTIAQQNEAIKNLQQQMATVQKQNKQLLNMQQALDVPKKTTKSVQTELKFDQPDGADDIPDLEPEDVERVPEQVEQKLNELQQDAPDDPRAEILTKAVENSEAAKQPQFRTLADMQLPKDKKHWWNRFRE